VKLGRKAIGIDINPIANFITRTTLEPVNLARLKQAFTDVESFCEENISYLFQTKCQACGGVGIIDFVVRQVDEPQLIGYTCSCSPNRLFKKPDKFDIQKESEINKAEVPFWYPHNVPLPTTRKEKYQYVHELFTKRNLIALSNIFYVIDLISDKYVKDVMRLAFSASLANSSRLKPLSKRIRA
jgi:H2-forming N5,N10-methylenetetrahydromethanopterin dehydrogenase-like enzyme